MKSATHRLGPVVWCVHRDGAWIRRGHGYGRGWVIIGPRSRPLFSERMGRGERVVLHVGGWRLKRMKAIASSITNEYA